MGDVVARRQQCGLEVRNLELNYSSPPYIPSGSPTPWVYTRISYTPLSHTPTRNRSRCDLHPQLGGRGQVAATGSEPSTGESKRRELAWSIPCRHFAYLF